MAIGMITPMKTGTNFPSSCRFLEVQLATWAQGTVQQTSSPVLRRGLVEWSWRQRLVSLEVTGHFNLMDFDPALLYAAEVDALLDAVGGGDQSYVLISAKVRNAEHDLRGG